jgi:AbiU2
MVERRTVTERIELAKTKMEKVLDHFLYVVELHANNSFVVHSSTLASQIPVSYAANAFNVFQRSMYQIEIVRLCAIWDRAGADRESIPTVVDLIDSADVIEMLAEETRSHHSGMSSRLLNPSDDPELAAIEHDEMRKSEIWFGHEQAEQAKTALRHAIDATRAIQCSPQLASVMNLRHKHLAHSLTQTQAEKGGPIPPMKYADGAALLDATIPIVEHLYCWVNGKSFSIKNSQEIDQENAEALWKGCKFEVLR